MRVSNSVFISTMGIYFCCPYPILDAFPLGFCAQDPLINEIPSSLHVRFPADHKPSALKVFHAVPACPPFPVHPKYLAQHQVHCAWITTGHISFRKSVSLKCISYLADVPACEWRKTIKNIFFKKWLITTAFLWKYNPIRSTVKLKNVLEISPNVWIDITSVT